VPRAPRQRNVALQRAIEDCNWTYDAFIAAAREVAREHGEGQSWTRSHVSHWISGARPSGSTPAYLAEAVSRRLGYVIKPTDLGFLTDGSVDHKLDGLDWWSSNATTDLVTVGRADLERRELALKALYSLAALAVPLDAWQEIADRGRRAVDGSATVGRGEVAAVREMLEVFSKADERFGGGHARPALVQYLTSDVAAYLRGTFTSEADRRAMFSAAAEMTYLAGWKAFDSSLHGLAQRYYVQSLRLANEADDRALAGFTLRAMAHQAVDLGHGPQALRLAESALDWSRGQATPAAAALFTVLTARGHAATGAPRQTSTAIRTAESLLSNAKLDGEPIWIQTSGFTDTSLASQAGQALRDLGDLAGAEAQFRRSIATRNADAHRRIHTLTLANIADVQSAQGHLREASENWNLALDYLPGIKSGRARDSVQNIRSRLSSLGPRLPAFMKRLDQRAAAILAGRDDSAL